MTQDQRWQQHCQEIIEYMERFRRRPSKHRVEDHAMLNWLKYNRKLLAQDALPPERKKQFKKVMALADKYQKVNQSAYSHPELLGRRKPRPTPSLFDLFSSEYNKNTTKRTRTRNPNPET